MKRLVLALASLVFLIFLVSCNSNKPDQGSRFGSPDYSTINRENKSRDAWQKPEELIHVLGDLSGYTIADIGAGTGYFTFRLALVAKNVIAVEIDPDMIDLIEAFKINLPERLTDKIETRLGSADSSNLLKGEADIIILINTIAYIDDKVSYLRHLYDVLPEGGRLVVVDYKQSKLPASIDRGPKPITHESLNSILRACFFKELKADLETLEYQFITIAQK